MEATATDEGGIIFPLTALLSLPLALFLLRRRPRKEQDAEDAEPLTTRPFAPDQVVLAQLAQTDTDGDGNYDARRDFVRRCADAPAAVPMGLWVTYRMYVDDKVSSRAEGHFHAWVCTQALGLESCAPLLRGGGNGALAAGMLASLASASLLETPSHVLWLESNAEKTMLAWLERARVEFDSRAAVHEAASRGDVEQLFALLEKRGGRAPGVAVGVDVEALLPAVRLEAACQWETALVAAAREGRTAAVAALTDYHGGNVDAPAADGTRPLHAACHGERSADTVALLLSRRADVHATGARLATPLHSAAFHGRLGATKVLLLNGADVTAVDDRNLTAHATVWLHARSREQACPCALFRVEPGRQWGAVQALLDKVASFGEEGAAETEEAGADESAATAFVRRSWGLEVAAALQAAVAAIPEPKPTVSSVATVSYQGMTRANRAAALAQAERLRAEARAEAAPTRAELQRLLVCYAADVDSRDQDGTTALHAAAERGDADAAEMLLRAGADVAACSNCGDTPLHCAAREGRLAACSLLVEKGGLELAQKRTKSGATPIDYALRNKSGHDWAAVVHLLQGLEIVE